MKSMWITFSKSIYLKTTKNKEQTQRLYGKTKARKKDLTEKNKENYEN